MSTASALNLGPAGILALTVAFALVSSHLLPASRQGWAPGTAVSGGEDRETSALLLGHVCMLRTEAVGVERQGSAWGRAGREVPWQRRWGAGPEKTSSI